MEFLKLSVVKGAGFCFLNFQSVVDSTFGIQQISISHRINCETVIAAYKSQHDLSLGLLLQPHLHSQNSPLLAVQTQRHRSFLNMQKHTLT